MMFVLGMLVSDHLIALHQAPHVGPIQPETVANRLATRKHLRAGQSLGSKTALASGSTLEI